MDIPDSFYNHWIARSVPSKYEVSLYRLSRYCRRDEAAVERRHEWRVSCRHWQNYAVRGMYTVMHIIAQTCIEQVSAGIDPEDLKFYQRCERNGESNIFELDRTMRIWLDTDDLSTELPELHEFESWIQSFLDKMKSLNTESSLMAAARVKHAREHYGKSLEEFQGCARTRYVDADPAHADDRFFDVEMFYMTITSMFMATRKLLANPPRKSSPPPAMTRTRSPSRMNTSKRSFADVLTGRDRLSRQTTKSF